MWQKNCSNHLEFQTMDKNFVISTRRLPELAGIWVENGWLVRLCITSQLNPPFPQSDESNLIFTVLFMYPSGHYIQISFSRKEAYKNRQTYSLLIVIKTTKYTLKQFENHYSKLQRPFFTV